MPAAFMVGQVTRSTTYQVVVTQGMESREVLVNGESIMRDPAQAQRAGMAALTQFPNATVEIVTTEMRMTIKKIEVLRATPMPRGEHGKAE